MAATKHNNKPNEALTVLMAAALALPGMSAQAADANVRNDSVVLSYNHGDYAESNKRMDARVDQVSVTVPLGDRYEVKLNTIRDVVSGASPFSNRVVAGKPVMILATAASIREKREVMDASVGYYGDDYYAGVNVGRSIENDYDAHFISASYRRGFNDKNTTVSVGAAFSSDEVWEKYYPLVANAKPSVYRDRHKHDLMVGVSQILDENSVAQLVLSHGYTYGYLNEQYRRAVIQTAKGPVFVADARPQDHTQWTALARYSHYFAAINSALHLDYRFGLDSWGADSHTVEGKLRVALGGGWSVAPGLRYYTQKNADFYQTYFTSAPANGLTTVDYRQAAFGALSPKLEVVKTFKNGTQVRASFENYLRNYSYRLSGARGNAIDNYHARLLSVSTDIAF
ncbi:DUF3570 domain-containing protein [Pseudoduganella sp. LjRoot289]|uniref:DUF3570 domain-containing protein n=1 Tax=Pseudoduganella sp. LjRoot289 TaxID=3342314 RepID=UPI003ECF37BE